MLPGPQTPQELDHKSAKDSLEKSSLRFERFQGDLARDRSSYFERLSLLNGGALVLSVTLLNYLSGRLHGGPLFVWSLYGAWGCLLAGLLSAVFRNLADQHYRFYQHFAWYARDVANLKKAEADLIVQEDQLVVDSDLKKIDSTEFASELEAKHKAWLGHHGRAEQKAETYLRVFQLLEVLSHAGLVSGLILMMFFSVINIR